MLVRCAPLVDRNSPARFGLRDGAVRAEPYTECRTTIHGGGRANDTRVEPQPFVGLVPSHPVSGCERHTGTSSEQRFRSRGR
jgi:hypothetical protein